MDAKSLLAKVASKKTNQENNTNFTQQDDPSFDRVFDSISKSWEYPIKEQQNGDMQNQEKSGNKVATKWQQKWQQSGNKVATKWQQKPEKWQQSGNKKIRKWTHNWQQADGKVATKWQQSGNKNHFWAAFWPSAQSCPFYV